MFKKIKDRFDDYIYTHEPPPLWACMLIGNGFGLVLGIVVLAIIL